MAVSAADIVAPVFTTAEVVVLFSSRMAAQASLGNLFGGLIFERDDFGWVTFLNVGLAWSMTRLAPGHLVFPTAQTSELRVGSRNEILELILVAVFASFASDVLVVMGSGASGEINGSGPPCEYEQSQYQYHSKHFAGKHFHDFLQVGL